MAKTFKLGDCVQIPDGRVARVREKVEGGYKVRVRRKTSATHQFVVYPASKLKRVACPKGWMSEEGYVRYLKTTLAKMAKRQKKKRSR
jgi:hypothetical protein